MLGQERETYFLVHFLHSQDGIVQSRSYDVSRRTFRQIFREMEGDVLGVKEIRTFENAYFLELSELGCDMVIAEGDEADWCIRIVKEEIEGILRARNN